MTFSLSGYFTMCPSFSVSCEVKDLLVMIKSHAVSSLSKQFFELFQTEERG